MFSLFSLVVVVCGCCGCGMDSLAIDLKDVVQAHGISFSFLFIVKKVTFFFFFFFFFVFCFLFSERVRGAVNHTPIFTRLNLNCFNCFFHSIFLKRELKVQG